MYGNNPYMPNYLNNLNQQSTFENIDSQINKLQQLKEQMKNNNQQPAINQTFQLAPNGTNGIKYVNSIEDVNKEHVFAETPFFSKDLSVMWLKNTSGNIKVYELNEIIAKDDKDMQIELLQAQLNELKGMIDNAKSNNDDVNETTSSKKSSNVSSTRTSTKKSK